VRNPTHCHRFLKVGNRWTYEHDWKSGDRNRPAAARWTIEETITGQVTIPEGLVVLRAVKQSNLTYAPSWLIARDSTPYLVHKGCVYVIGDGWNRQHLALVEPPREDGRLHIFCSHFGSGGAIDVWFQNDVGVVEEHYIHNGTYDEYTKKLLSFMPGQ